MAGRSVHLTLSRPEPTGVFNRRTMTVSQGVLPEDGQQFAGTPRGLPLTGMHVTKSVDPRP